MGMSDSLNWIGHKTVVCQVWLLLCHQGDSNETASLFTGEEELFAFERVLSRITEMRSAAYWTHAEELHKQSEFE